VVSGLDVGVGFRILFDKRTIYGFTNQISKETLFDLAKSLNCAVKEDGSKTQANRSLFSRPFVLNLPSSIGKDPEGVSIEEKASIVKRANDVARRLDPHVRQAKVIYRDHRQLLSIADSDGTLVKGDRVGTIFSVQVVSADGDRVQTGYEAVGGRMGFELFNLHPPEEVAGWLQKGPSSC